MLSFELLPDLKGDYHEYGWLILLKWQNDLRDENLAESIFKLI